MQVCFMLLAQKFVKHRSVQIWSVCVSKHAAYTQYMWCTCAACDLCTMSCVCVSYVFLCAWCVLASFPGPIKIFPGNEVRCVYILRDRGCPAAWWGWRELQTWDQMRPFWRCQISTRGKERRYVCLIHPNVQESMGKPCSYCSVSFTPSHAKTRINTTRPARSFACQQLTMTMTNPLELSCNSVWEQEHTYILLGVRICSVCTPHVRISWPLNRQTTHVHYC